MSSHDDLIAQFVDVAGVAPQEVREGALNTFLVSDLLTFGIRPVSTLMQHNGTFLLQ
jgi:hypothetical protein